MGVVNDEAGLLLHVGTPLLLREALNETSPGIGLSIQQFLARHDDQWRPPVRLFRRVIELRTRVHPLRARIPKGGSGCPATGTSIAFNAQAYCMLAQIYCTMIHRPRRDRPLRRPGAQGPRATQ